MHLRVLGSAAGGGFPQWNCNCRNCKGFRNQEIKSRARTQSSIALSDDGKNWVIVNTSPDIRSQLMAFPEIQPGIKARDTAISAVVLTDAQIDHSSGLLFLREGCPIPVFCTEQVKQDLSSGFSLFPLLKHWNGGLEHTNIQPGKAFTIEAVPKLEWLPIPVRSNAPPYSPRRGATVDGDNIGLLITHKESGKSLLYLPGLGEITENVTTLCSKADCLLLEGTFWTENEMQLAGVGNKLASEMGHLPLSGETGLITFLQQFPDKRKVLIHINNTNPILDENSEQAMLLEELDIEVSFDGMELHLQ